jgi:hypothetical protein
VLRETLQAPAALPLLAPLVIVMAICGGRPLERWAGVPSTPALTPACSGFRPHFVVPPSMGEAGAPAPPLLSADDVAYCRQVTRVWCVFFVANGASAWLAAHERWRRGRSTTAR